jgi:lysophospholipase L1-like esterase
MFSCMIRNASKLLIPCFVSCLAAIAQAPSPEAVAKAHEVLQQWRQAHASALLDDFGQLARYREADASLKAPAPGERRVVFMGDSITESWDLAKYFPGKPYINRGIGGQTTPQMLIRFRQDVIDLKPSVVVILAGTNDIAGNTGPMTLDEIEANYSSMAELARSNGIDLVLSSVTPVSDYGAKAANAFLLRSPQKILALNGWIKEYCAKTGAGCLDYFSAMVDDKGMLKRDLAEDGLHPNAAGYVVMAPLAEKAIQQALNQGSHGMQEARPKNPDLAEGLRLLMTNKLVGPKCQSNTRLPD